jgi:tetratricopeptide (TPR) repeat protein
VSLDRAATLRNAEKLLRQGKLELAMAEYLRVVEEFPRDWNTGNILGDLYVRAGQLDNAVDRFVRIADSLIEEGFLPKASAIYKKVLKLKPDHEHALLQGADIASSQGLLADARACLNALLDKRRSRGDQRGVAQIRIRLAMLDPADYAARFTAARARIDMNDKAAALSDFKALAAELVDTDRQSEAVEALREAASLAPDDPEIRARLLQVHLKSGDYAKAREYATTSAELKEVAAQLEDMGQPEEALAMLREAARLEPGDIALSEHLARVFVERGDLTSAAEYLTVDAAGNNPLLLLMVAEMRLRDGRLDEGLDIARRVLEIDPLRRQDVAMIGWTVAEQSPEAGFKTVQLAAEIAVSHGDWPSAAAALQEFVTRLPNHIPALMRLVEVCVDGGLEATLYSAQAQLADAYIAAGLAAEARFIAEDLVAREPWERANIERFRRTLVLLGEADPDGLIAERLSGQSPFTSTDLSLRGDELPPFDPASPTVDLSSAAQNVELVVEEIEPLPTDPSAEERLMAAPAPASIEVEHLLASPTAHGRSESVEVDLSIVLSDIPKPEVMVPPPAAEEPSLEPRTEAPPRTPIAAHDLDGVFAQLREEAARRSSQGGVEDEFKRGMTLLNDGKVDDAIPVLQAVAKSPRLRFVASSTLGRVFRDRGMMPQAVEWLERAAEAPPSTPEEGYQLLYDLADALEAIGETARALAICIELQAEAGDFRDIGARVEHLAKVQARG